MSPDHRSSRAIPPRPALLAVSLALLCLGSAAPAGGAPNKPRKSRKQRIAAEAYKAARRCDVKNTLRLMRRAALDGKATAPHGTPFIRAVLFRTPEARAGECARLVRALIARGADVHGVGEHGNSLLHGAAVDGHLEVMKVVIEAGARLDARAGQGGDAAAAGPALGTAGRGPAAHRRRGEHLPGGLQRPGRR